MKFCGEVESVAWAPDGRHLALSVASVALANPYNGIHVIDVRTGDDRLIHACFTAPDESSCDYYDLAWSRDSSRLAYVNGGRIAVVDADADGDGRLLLPTHTHGRETSPTWSPDAARIAFAVESRGQSSIYAVDLDGSHRRLLAAGGRSPAWSSWGTIAYRTDCGIELMTATGEREVPHSARIPCGAVLPRGFAAPAWSPDGRGIAATAGSPRHSVAGIPLGTYVVDADGGNLRRVTAATGWTGMLQKPRVAWRPVP